MSNKKDLTRIEDLSEFIHALEDEDEFQDSEAPSSDLPDIPAHEGPQEDPFAFSSDDSDKTQVTSFSSEDLKEVTFDANETAEEESVDFGTDDFTTSFDAPSEASYEEPEDSSEETAVAEDNKEEEFLSEATAWNVDVPLTETQNTPEETDKTPTYTPDKDFKTPETFEDLKKFSESSSFTGMAVEGNPSFSVLIKNVHYIEDVNDIITLLRELSLLGDSEDSVKSRLMRGMLLVPRISEYAAIFLAHKLRRFDVDILLGPSDEIHPPKHQEAPETGIVSKHSLYQNQSHHFHFDDPKLELSQIIVAATPSLEGHQVLRYMGVASEHKMLDSHVVEDEGSDEVPRHYQELAQKLKAHALKAHANAVVGLNYQLTPIPTEFGMGGHKYRLTCTGNLVWVNKL